MTPNKFDFLVAILGFSGASALSKAAERNAECESVLVPRAILAWLAIAGDEFKGSLPGVESVSLTFRKSEDKYTGQVGSYGFSAETLLHLASAVAVAIGLDAEHFDPNLRDLDLVRLGKSIDLLAKTHAMTLRVDFNEELMKAISLIPPGPEVREPRVASGEVKAFNYSHVLPAHHQRGGFTMQVRHHLGSGTVVAKVYKGPLEVGSVKGTHENGALNIENAEVNEQHQGKGFGTALYEGLMAHAHHSGIKTMNGGVHSTMASGLHQKLSRKHGMDYKSTPTPFPHLADPTPGPFDNRVGPYNYAIKDEIPASTKKAEAPGPAHAQTPQGGPGAPAPAVVAQSVKGPPKPKKPVQPPGAAKPVKTLKVSKSQSERACGLCGLSQFKAGAFRGCACFRDLSKSVKTVADGDGYRLELAWGTEEFHTLIEALGSK